MLQTQTCILTTLSTEINITRLKNLIANLPFYSFTNFAESACKEFNFIGPTGHPQISTCEGAIRTLEARGLLTLPESWAAKTRNCTLKTLDESVPLPTPPARLSSLENDVKLVLVQTPEERVLFNTIVKEEVNNNFQQLPPRQLCYLMQTDEGIIGIAAVTSAMINHSARDTFVGWNQEERFHYLHYVANLKIFHLRDGYQELGQVIIEQLENRIREDFSICYKIDLMLLEAVVDLDHVKIFNTYNWTLVTNKTPLKLANNERSLRKFNPNKSTDSLFMYKFDQEFKDKLAPHTKQIENNIEYYLNDNSWIERELVYSPYDPRLVKREISLIKAKYHSPEETFLRTCNGSKKEVKGYYRLMETKNRKFNFDNILYTTYINTGIRSSSYQTVLWVSDGSDLNYSHIPHCTGLGLVGTKHQVPGEHLHLTLGLTTNELVLGIGHATCGDIIHRNEDEKGNSIYIPAEDKNSYVWYIHAKKISELMSNYEAMNIFVADRGADDFGLFAYIISLINMEFVIRSQYNRKLEGETKKLHDLIRKEPSKGNTIIEIEDKRKNSSNKSNRGKNKKNRKVNKKKKNNSDQKSNFVKRKVNFNVTYKEVTIAPPQSHAKNESPIKLTVIRAWESAPIPGKERKEWILLTSLKIRSVEDAIKCILYYRSRWRVEEYFRVLKSGCGVEKVGYDTAERVLRSIAINLIVAWRLLLIGLLGEKLPNLPPDIMFNDYQMLVIKGYAMEHKNVPPPNTLGGALFITGLIGGANITKSYPTPGYMSIIRGLSELYTSNDHHEWSIMGKEWQI